MISPQLPSAATAHRFVAPSLLALAGAVLLASCAAPPPPPPPTPAVVKKEPFKMYEWNGEGATGAASITIYLDKQKAFYYRDGKMLAWTYVATGTSAHPTPAGDFKVIEKVRDKQSNLYGKLVNAEGDVVNRDFDTRTDSVPEGHRFDAAKMPLYLRLTNDGVGMHVGPIPRPGRPASHGCIRMPRFMAEKFFANVPVGTPVSIVSTSPEEVPVTQPGTEPEKKGWSLFGGGSKPEVKKTAAPTT